MRSAAKETQTITKGPSTKVTANPKPAPPTAQTVMLKVEGMTCRGCASSACNALSKLDGVCQIEVDAATDSAKVVFDPKATTTEQLIEAVNKCGFKASQQTTAAK